MSEIIICGHRNPDMDSVCSAYAYAELKNTIDPSNTYIPVRCGHLTEGVKGQFKDLGLTAPSFRKDIYPKVSDVVRRPIETIGYMAPVYDLVKIYNDTHPSVVPVFKEDSFYGLLSIDDITAWFLRENSEQRPKYNFEIDNFPKVVKGTLIKRGKPNLFYSELLAGAMDLETFKERLSSLEYPVLVIGGSQTRHIQYAISRRIPAIVLTGCGSCPIDFSGFEGSVFCTNTDTAEALRLLRMTSSVCNIMGKQGKGLQMSDLFADGRDRLSSSNLRGLPVFENETWKGFVTRRCFLETPRCKVIMVDHNEAEQAIAGIETAQVLEIIDHHRLDAEKTSSPIFIDSEPLGSTCTIVYHLFQRYHVTPSKDTARVLLSGILADTVLLKSPTTTFDDYTACEELTQLSGISDMQAFGRTMYSRSNRLSDCDPRTLIEGDFKRYKEQGVSVGIGQCEVTTLEDVHSCEPKLLQSLEEVRKAYDLDWTVLMITDVFKEESILLSSDFKLSAKLSYEVLENGCYFMPGVLSRKKQLLPEILRVIDES